MLLRGHFLIFDLNFDRLPTAAFQQALARKGAQMSLDEKIGRPATVNALFCRDVVEERDHPDHFPSHLASVTAGQLIKLAIICELYGLNDSAVDAIAHGRDVLAGHLDVEYALELLADPSCRMGTPEAQNGLLRRENLKLACRLRSIQSSTSWRATAPLRALVSALRGGNR